MEKKAFEADRLDEALRIYTEELTDFSEEEDLKSKAILYTNRATIYNTLKQHELALQDAESAIKADPISHKVCKIFSI